ncbi:DUF7446 family protein [Microvirgula aerodenitrificans]|uniref:DUF7446 family protein n=1 Tax=Microvirgula aerodenitrificans TaxID=57480 RepID=UPI00248E3785|nr:hypothetical protein [Microvirgula aerodenitrificans]
MKELHVGCSPLTKRIYCGTLLKGGLSWAAGKQDVTGAAVGAVIEHIGAGNAITVTLNGVPAYEVSVRDIRQEATA